jgi:arsenate reductase
LVKIYHNPRCSKSRQTLALLQENGVAPEEVLYLDTPPTPAELEAICTALGCEPLTIIRTKEARFTELGLSTGDERPRDDWLQLMADNPILIERPIVVDGDRAVVGRPPENVLGLL